MTVAVVVSGVVALGVTSSAQAVEVVDDDGVQCPSATHTTIQDGVNAASVGEQVQVCNGTYREAVTITTDGVDLVSKTTRGATISPPPGLETDPGPRALVHIDGASNAKVRRFRIVGPGTGTNESLRYGVLVDGNHTEVAAQVLDNLIADIRDTQPAATGTGTGVAVGSYTGGVSNPGRAIVQRNEITRYQTVGIRINETGTFVNAANNTIRGLGLITGNAPPPAQTGIQLGFDSAATVTGNKVSENKYSGAGGEAGIGITVVFNPTAKDPYGPTRSRVKTNTLTNNDYGLVMFDARNWLIETNRIFGNGDPNTAAGDGGILVFETAEPSGGSNRFNRNDARSNEGLDCDDQTTGFGTAGTGNTWTGNRGIDDFPGAICAP